MLLNARSSNSNIGETIQNINNVSLIEFNGDIFLNMLIYTVLTIIDIVW